MIPKEWRVSRLGDIATIKGGKRLPKGRPFAQNITPYPYIRVSDFSNGSVSLANIVYVLPEDREKIKKYTISDRDLYISIAGSIGVVGTIPPSLNGAQLTENAAKISPSHEVELAFLNYVMQASYVKAQILNAKGTGGGVPKLALFRIEDLEIILPNKDVQRVIASILRCWDRAIDLTEKLLAEKQGLRRGLGQQMLSGKRRLQGFEKKNGRRKTPWGTYPQDWEHLRIGQLANHVSVKNSGGAALPVLSCTKHRGLVDSLEYFGKQVFSKDLSTYKVVLRGQFAYATNHIEEGSIGYQDLYDSAVISPMYTVFKAGPKIEDRFLYLLLKTNLYRHIFDIKTSASVDRRGSLRWPEFSRITVPVPSLDEQRAIIKIFSLLDREVEMLEAKFNALLEQKKGLMQQLLTGKKRVTTCAT